MSMMKKLSDIITGKPAAVKWRVIPRRSTTSGKVPSSLEHLQLCLNTTDGLIWIGDLQGAPVLIKELTNSPKIFKEQS